MKEYFTHVLLIILLEQNAQKYEDVISRLRSDLMFRRPKTDREELFEGAQAVIQGEGNTMLYYHRYLYDSE